MNFKIINKLEEILKSNPTLFNDVQSLQQVVNGTFNIEIEIDKASPITVLSEKINNAVLAQYFSTVWQPETKKYKYSGLTIVDEVNAMNPEAVIDIGCGYNEFKGKINNLIGIDPYNPRADVISKVEDYETDTLFDVAICLGSINFGSTETILKELNSVSDLVKPGGIMYFRVNPGEQHAAFESRWINFYGWDPTFISSAAQYLNCSLEILRQDTGNRYYFVLRKQ